MFKINKNLQGVQIGIYCSLNNIWIPFDPANTDYANFKRDIADGAELQDADGNVMTAEAAKEFVRGLP